MQQEGAAAGLPPHPRGSLLEKVLSFAAMVAADVIGTATALAGMVKGIADALTAARSKSKTTKEARIALEHAQDATLAVQSRLLDLQQQALALEQQNGRLAAQLRECEERLIQRSNYETVKIGQSWVVVPKGAQEPQLCPTCFETGKLCYLMKAPAGFTDMGTHVCPNPACRAFATLR